MASISAVAAVYRLTFDDWSRLPEDGNRYEIIGGEIFGERPPTWRHQLIATEFHFRLRSYLGSSSRGRIAPNAGIRLSNEDVVKPDLAVFLEEHRERIDEGSAAAGTPDLVVEILSPGTAGRDLRDKRVLYERSGIPEYWIVDPIAETVQVFALEGGIYREAALFRRGDTLLSPLLPELKFPLVGTS